MKNQPSANLQEMIFKVKELRKKLKTKPELETDDDHEEGHSSTIEVHDRNQVWNMSFIFWFAGVLIVYIGYLLYSSLDLIYLIFTGYIFSMAIEKMIGWFTKKFGNRGRGIFLSYFILIAVLLSGVLIMIPFLGGQISDIGSIIIRAFNNIQTQLQAQGLAQMISTNSWIPGVFKEGLIASISSQNGTGGLQQLFQDNLNQIVSTSSTYLQGAGGIAVSVVSSIINALTQVGFVLTLAVLFSIEKENILKLIRRFDKRHHNMWYNKVTQIYDKLGFWLTSQLLLCLFIFGMSLIGLFILSLFGIKIPGIFSLAIIAGLTEMIPYIGPLLGSVPALMVGTINNGLSGFISVGVLFFVIQWCENNVLIPWIMNKTLGVSSLLIFICMLIGASTFGFIGIILAVPIAIIISIATEE